MLKNTKSKLGIVGELFSFLWKRKLFWLYPMIVLLIIFGLLFVFTAGSPLAPFIYSLI